MADPAFASKSAFAGLLHDHGNRARGVVVADRSGVGLATVIAPRASTGNIAAVLGFEPPQLPRRVGSDELALIGIGPGRWLAVGETLRLDDRLRGLATVIDQTDGYGVLRLGGPHVRNAMMKGIEIDLHPDAFPVGSTATTHVAHIGVTFWRLDDAPDGTAQFEIAMFRSMAGSFWRWLSLGAAEFGLAIEPAMPSSFSHG